MKIEFEHKLPAWSVEGRPSGNFNNPELAVPGVLTVNDTDLGNFMQLLRNIVREDRRLIFIDGRRLTVSNNWIRDHTHEMKGFCHWEYDLCSFLDFILENQREDGQFFELIKQMDDYHWQFVDEDCRKMFYDDNLAMVRLEIEADVEYLVVECAARVYGVTGDKAWLQKALPHLERGIRYMTSDRKRWDSAHGLVKRAFTIDTWDFKYGCRGEDRHIYDDTQMSVMHGDNTGVYSAMLTLARFRRILGDESAAAEWEAQAAQLRENIFKYLYNGKFFMHLLHLGHEGADNLENERLSLSNAYALNRHILTLEQGRGIIEEYRNRRQTPGYFAEWFTIYPPYEKFLVYESGDYVNGAVSPFTAGELARGAFEYGYEAYGWDILSRFIRMTQKDGKVFFLYSPQDGAPQEGLGPSGWGAASLLNAVDEGLMGIVNTGVGYETIAFSPRLPVTHYTEIRYFTGYEKTECFVEMRYIIKENGMRYDLISPAKEIKAHIYTGEKAAARVYVNGVQVPFASTAVADSHYADFTVTESPHTTMEILWD